MILLFKFTPSDGDQKQQNLKIEISRNLRGSDKKPPQLELLTVLSTADRMI
jgi:hypothetical protein